MKEKITILINEIVPIKNIDIIEKDEYYLISIEIEKIEIDVIDKEKIEKICKEFLNHRPVKLIFNRAKVDTDSVKVKRRIKGVKHIILVASGKGGVGKSTIAANLAIAISQMGWRTGLLDADIYGASIPLIFDLASIMIDVNKNNLMQPVEKYGVTINSVGFIVQPDEALIWRGPMLAKILMQLLLQTAWGELDYLIIDTPPGTGDVHLSLCENFNLDGYLLVSTPHITSIANSKKTQNMFEKFAVKNLGLVVNMTDFDHQNIFGNLDEINKITIKNKFYIPLIKHEEEYGNLFIRKPEYEKYFIEMARNIIQHLAI